jgi:uncharacterized protein (TIGR03437 family)
VDGAPRGDIDTYRAPAQAQSSAYSITGLAPGTHTLTIEVTDTHNPSSGGSWVWLDAFEVTADSAPAPPSQPAINSGGLVNAASMNGLGASGSIASIFGTSFATGQAWAGSLPLPTTLGSTMVRVNGIPAPLFYVSPTQINFQLPWELAGQSTVSVTVATGNTISGALTVALAQFAPGIFAVNSSGGGQGAILVGGTSAIAAPEGAIAGARPVERGGTITIFCTGLGAVSAPPVSGAAASSANPPFTMAMPFVSVGGSMAPITYAGLAPGYVGLYQINARVPDSVAPGTQVPVFLSIRGVTSNTVTIAVR